TEGKVGQVLDRHVVTGTAVDSAVLNHEIPYIGDAAVELQDASLKAGGTEDAKVGRVDLSELALVTIDGEDARYFDDAVYCEKKRGGGWRLLVAIAYLSYYVRPPTPLDRQARHRGPSVYFPVLGFPMLPQAPPNRLCFLNPPF
ncbi:RNB domain-containing ribonuclease, partial [Salmonella enterica]|uniref:RNB domain-containing ribonuclease n=1 Tax=Salmonella enterica TaxID=28901 RepID=UPI00398C5DE7